MQDLQPFSAYPRPPSGYGATTYLPTVDGLRRVAIILVLWYHTPFLFRDLPEFSAQQSPWGHAWRFRRDESRRLDRRGPLLRH
jgi:hypothetical protein